MLTGKYVTIDYVKEQARKILNFENTLSKNDIAELVWDILTKLKDPNLFVTKVTDGKNGPSPVDVINYRGLLPLDMVGLINHTVRNHVTKQKLIPTENPNFLADKDLSDNTEEDTLDDEFDFKARVDPASGYNVIDKYLIQDGEIHTTLKEGELEISYKALPLDINNYPKIPDESKLIELIKWAILERAAIQLWYQDRLTERKYNHIESKYLFYKKSASNQLKISSIPEMEAMKNRLLRLRADTSQYQNDFIDFGYPEEFNKHDF